MEQCLALSIINATYTYFLKFYLRCLRNDYMFTAIAESSRVTEEKLESTFHVRRFRNILSIKFLNDLLKID